MTPREAKRELSTIADRLADRPEGVGWADVDRTFRADKADDLDGLRDVVFDDWLRRFSADATKAAAAARHGQQPIPGMADTDWGVTYPDGEGGWRRKSLRYATVADLEADLALHAANVADATNARDRVRRRNDQLIPIMRREGFATAGEAVAWLNSPTGDPQQEQPR